MRFLSILKSILLPAGLVVLGVLAIITVNAEAPAPATTTAVIASPVSFTGDGRLNLISGALSDFDANNVNADSAPKQQVVAGWATKDLLSVVGLQNAEVISGIEAVNANLVELQEVQAGVVDSIKASVPPIDDRPRRLLALGVLAICWFGVWGVVPTLNGRGRGSAVTTGQSAGGSAGSMEVVTAVPSLGSEAPQAGGPWNAPGTTA